MNDRELIMNASMEMEDIRPLYEKYEELDIQRDSKSRWANMYLNAGILLRFILNVPIWALVETFQAVLMEMGFGMRSVFVLFYPINLVLVVWTLVTMFIIKEYNPVHLILKKIFQPKIDELEEEIENIVTEVEIRTERTQWLSQIPAKYAFPQAIDSLVEYITTHRADSLKEAINLFEEEMHRRRLEMGQQEMLQIQEETCKAAKGARSAATMAALFTAYSLFDD